MCATSSIVTDSRSAARPESTAMNTNNNPANSPPEMPRSFSCEFIPLATFETQAWTAEQFRNHNLFGRSRFGPVSRRFQFLITAQEARHVWASRPTGSNGTNRACWESRLPPTISNESQTTHTLHFYAS